MGLSAGTGWRAFGLGLFSYGRAAIFRCPLFCGHTGRECAVRRSYRLLSENRSVGGKRAFQGVFCLLRPIPPVRMRFIGMRLRLACMCDAPSACPFGRAWPCADAHVYKRSGDTPVSECRRRVGPSARCPSQSVSSQSAVSRRLLLRQKEEKALQLPFCSAVASTSSGRFAKKSKPVSRSISSTETT